MTSHATDLAVYCLSSSSGQGQLAYSPSWLKALPVNRADIRRAGLIRV